MKQTPHEVQRTYLVLLFGHTLAASLIWGINTIFLLNAGLNNAQVFTANAFATLGSLLFEIPTGVIADLKGRRVSYLLGVTTLAVSTFLYWLMWHNSGPFWGWAAVSFILGIGFTFFSGATDAWLVDALHATNYKGKLDNVFARGQIVAGAAMLIGSVAGGIIAQVTNLGVPYIFRSAILVLTFIYAFIYMKDVGFTPTTGKRPLKEVRRILDESVHYGLRNKPVRWVMLTMPFAMGVLGYVFYALQPYLLQLYGNPNAYSIAGLAAAIVAGSQIAGGVLAPRLGRIFKRRTSFILFNVIAGAVILALTGLLPHFWIVIVLMVGWGLLFAAVMPIRSAYINALIPSKQRATVLSFDSLLGSAGGVVAEPALGRAADIWSYPASYVMSAGVQLLAVPFAVLARKDSDKTADEISPHENPTKVQK